MTDQTPYLTIQSVCQMVQEGQPIPLRIGANLEMKVLCPGPDDGDAGAIPTTTPLLVPEIATMLISPMGCGIHLNETGRGPHFPGRTWLLRLEEKDIVIGRYQEILDQAIETILQEQDPPIRGLILCGTCIDVLLGTDYQGMAKALEKKHGIRITSQIMGPILKDTPKWNTYQMYSAIYGLIRKPQSTPPYSPKSVNVLGCLTRPVWNSELDALLRQGSIEQVHYIGEYATLGDCDEMASAVLNLVYGEKALAAARDMERKFGIPYVEMAVSYDPDIIHNNYLLIGQKLGIHLDDSSHYQHLLERRAGLRARFSGLHCAVGERNGLNTLRSAVEAAKLGFCVDAAFVRKVYPRDLDNLNWLQEHCPQMNVYFDSHPGMWNYAKSPERFDLVFGVPLPFLKRCPSVIEGPMMYPYFDYASAEWFLNALERALDMQTHHPVCTPSPEVSSPWGKQWGTIRGLSL